MIPATLLESDYYAVTMTLSWKQSDQNDVLVAISESFGLLHEAKAQIESLNESLRQSKEENKSLGNELEKLKAVVDSQDTALRKFSDSSLNAINGLIGEINMAGTVDDLRKQGS